METEFPLSANRGNSCSLHLSVSIYLLQVTVWWIVTACGLVIGIIMSFCSVPIQHGHLVCATELPDQLSMLLHALL